MSQTIKISGVPDELMRRLDDRWRAEQYTDRSEYIRELVRRDLKAASLGEFVRQTFGESSADLAETETANAVDAAVREVRAERRKRTAA